jgi:hypothetical protein
MERSARARPLLPLHAIFARAARGAFTRAA